MDEIEALQRDLDKAEDEKQALRDEIVDLKTKIEQLEESIEEAKRMFDSIKADAGQMYRDLERLRNL